MGKACMRKMSKIHSMTSQIYAPTAEGLHTPNTNRVKQIRLITIRCCQFRGALQPQVAGRVSRHKRVWRALARGRYNRSFGFQPWNKNSVVFKRSITVWSIYNVDLESTGLNLGFQFVFSVFSFFLEQIKKYKIHNINIILYIEFIYIMFLVVSTHCGIFAIPGGAQAIH